MTTGVRTSGLDRQDVLAIVLIGALWVAMTLAANPIGDFPLNDDWMYGATVKSLLTGNGLDVPGAVRGPTVANILTQALWGAAFCLPAGFSFTALRISTLVLGLVGLVFFFALMRENGYARRMAAVSTLALSVTPLYFGMAESFMTDVPFVAEMIVALYFLTRALREESAVCLLTGVMICFVAILTKQIGVTPLVGYAFAAAVKGRFRLRPTLLGAVPLGLGLALHFGYRTWLTSTGRGSFLISQLIPLDPLNLGIWSVHSTIYALPYIGFTLLPVVALTGLLPASVRVRPIVYPALAAGGAVVLGLLWWKGDSIPTLGNIFNNWGMGPLTQRDTYLLRQNLPPVTAAITAFWLIVTACGLVGAVALFTIGGSGVRTRLHDLRQGRAGDDDWLWIMAVATGVAYWCMIIVLSTYTAEFWDRYVLPVLPIALILLAAGDARASPVPRPSPRTGLAGVLLVLAGVLSFGAAHDYLAWNRARWTALNDLTGEMGIAPAAIDGGYEFGGRLLYQTGSRRAAGKSWWWVDDDEYLTAAGPLPGYREIRRYPVGKFLPVGVDQVVVLHRTDAVR